MRQRIFEYEVIEYLEDSSDSRYIDVVTHSITNPELIKKLIQALLDENHRWLCADKLNSKDFKF